MSKKKNYKEGYFDHYLAMYSVHFSENRELQLSEENFEAMLKLYKKHHGEEHLDFLKQEIEQAQSNNDWQQFAGQRNKFSSAEDVESIGNFVKNS